MMILLSQHHEFWNKRHSLLFIHSLILPSTFSLMRSYFVAQDGFSSQSSYLHLLSVAIACAPTPGLSLQVPDTRTLL